MSEHDTETNLPEVSGGETAPDEQTPDAHEVDATGVVAPEVAASADAPADAPAPTDAPTDAPTASPESPAPAPAPVQGSGASAAGQAVPLTVSASDPKAFGASLDDIACGRVSVRFDA